MRIRAPFAAAFLVLLALSAFGGLLPHSSLPPTPAAPFTQSDKVLHFLTFFVLTATFYFILDATRRRVLHLTLLVCTLGLGVGSEVVQGLLPNDRKFDPFDIAANVVGSLCAVGLANWIHRRSAERRRKAKYSVLGAAVPEGEEDVELGEGPGLNREDEMDAAKQTRAAVAIPKTIEEEVDNWDENAEEDDAWDDDDDGTMGDSAGTKMTPASSAAGDEDLSKKVAVD